MSIHRRYEWEFRGISFWAEKDWPDSWLDHLESCSHEETRCENYGYYVDNDPYAYELGEFVDSVMAVVRQHVDIGSMRDELEAQLAFVQHLRYLQERGEYPRYPMETVIDRGGDCEDTAILMAFLARRIGYRCAFIHFESDGFLGLGRWGHVDLGVAESYDGEFHGHYWRHDGEKYYYLHCNGINREIGEYSGKWGNKAFVTPI